MKRNYFVIPLVTVLVAALGSWLTSGGIDSGWYGSLAKPAWTPPGSVIGAIWTAIFIMATISALIVWNRAPRDGRFRRIIAVFVANAVLNVLWSFLFFNQHLLGMAAAEAVLLGASVIILVILIWPLGMHPHKLLLTVAAILLIPYAAWATFAASLTYLVFLLNQ